MHLPIRILVKKTKLNDSQETVHACHRVPTPALQPLFSISCSVLCALVMLGALRHALKPQSVPQAPSVALREARQAQRVETTRRNCRLYANAAGCDGEASATAAAPAIATQTPPAREAAPSLPLDAILKVKTVRAAYNYYLPVRNAM